MRGRDFDEIMQALAFDDTGFLTIDRRVLTAYSDLGSHARRERYMYGFRGPASSDTHQNIAVGGGDTPADPSQVAGMGDNADRGKPSSSRIDAQHILGKPICDSTGPAMTHTDKISLPPVGLKKLMNVDFGPGWVITFPKGSGPLMNHAAPVITNEIQRLLVMPKMT